MCHIVSYPHPQFDAGNIAFQFLQARHEPLIRNPARAGDGDLAGAGPRADSVRDTCDIEDQPRYIDRVVFADGRQSHAGRHALEKLGANERFQLADLPADGALRQAQLVARAGEAAQTGRGLKNNKRLQRRQSKRRLHSGSQKQSLRSDTPPPQTLQFFWDSMLRSGFATSACLLA
ncbi:hypothetical protein D3C87_1465750 [compost metagenome]